MKINFLLVGLHELKSYMVIQMLRRSPFVPSQWMWSLTQ